MEALFGPAFDRPPVMLLASLPVEEEEEFAVERSLEIQEAVLSFARAAFSRGHRVVVPADGFVAMLLTAVAAEYRTPPRSEELREAPPQLMIGMLGSAEEELAGWPRRVVPPGVLQRRFDSFADFVGLTEPGKAIVVGGGGGESRDERVERFDRLRGREMELLVMGPTLTDFAREQGWGEWDVTRDLLGEIEWPEPGAEHRDDSLPLGAESVTPYAYLMQRLLETDEEDGLAVAVGGLHGER
jgi:hypothetical protein